jgi:hypothetical protein
MSARDAEEPRRLWDVVTLALVLVALVVDGIALAGIVSRLAEFGITANRLAALGENVVLLVNLILVAIGYVRFVAGLCHSQRRCGRLGLRKAGPG